MSNWEETPVEIVFDLWKPWDPRECITELFGTSCLCDDSKVVKTWMYVSYIHPCMHAYYACMHAWMMCGCMYGWSKIYLILKQFLFNLYNFVFCAFTHLTPKLIYMHNISPLKWMLHAVMMNYITTPYLYNALAVGCFSIKVVSFICRTKLIILPCLWTYSKPVHVVWDANLLSRNAFVLVNVLHYE